jgi:hypothetical protein
MGDTAMNDPTDDFSTPTPPLSDDDAETLARSMRGIMALKGQIATLSKEVVDLQNAVALRDQQLTQLTESIRDERMRRIADDDYQRIQLSTAMLERDKAIAERGAYEQLFAGMWAQMNNFNEPAPVLSERSKRRKNGNKEKINSIGFAAVEDELNKDS